MAIGFPASSDWSKVFDVEPTLLRHLVRQTVEKLGWRYEMHGTNTIVGHIPASMSSWGELVTITVEQDGTVFAESKCAWGQIFDWGKNRSNLDEFHAGLLSTIRNADLDPALPSRSVDADGSTPLERAIRSTDQEPE